MEKITDNKHWIKEKRQHKCDEIKKKLEVNKEKVDLIKSKGFDKERSILKALEKSDMNVDKAIEFLTYKKGKKEERKGHYQQMREELYKEFFPQDKEFDWNKFHDKKEDLKAEKRLRKEALYKQTFPEDKEFDWKKFRCLKKSEKKSKNKKHHESCTSSSEEDPQDSKEYSKFKKYKKEKRIFEKKTPKEGDDIKAKRIETVLSSINSKEIKKIYLDGNNMLFVEDAIRKDCLNKKGLEGEKKLANISLEYAKKAKIETCLLVFDRTKQVLTNQSEGVKFSVSSAHPEFESTDDAFKCWAGVLNEEELKSSLFVTSDRELTDRLREKKVVFILRSGEFMKEAKKLIGDESYAKLLI